MKRAISIIRKYHLMLLFGGALIFSALALNVWLIEHLFVPDSVLEWPNTFYVYLIQGILGGLGVLFLAVNASYDAIERYFELIGGKGLAVLVFLCLLLIDILLQVLFLLTVDRLGDSDLGLLYRLFHIEWEKNIPATYSALQLMFAGVVALICMNVQGKGQDSLQKLKYVWFCVAVVFFYLAVDEYIQIHESAANLLVALDLKSPDIDNRLGGFGWAWTIVGGFFVLVIGIPFLFFFKIIFSDYPYLLYLLVLSGIVFVFGAIGMENLQVYIEAHGVDAEKKYILVLEEFFEMLGVSIAIFVFIRYCGELQLSWEKNIIDRP